MRITDALKVKKVIGDGNEIVIYDCKMTEDKLRLLAGDLYIKDVEIIVTDKKSHEAITKKAIANNGSKVMYWFGDIKGVIKLHIFIENRVLIVSTLELPKFIIDNNDEISALRLSGGTDSRGHFNHAVVSVDGEVLAIRNGHLSIENNNKFIGDTIWNELKSADTFFYKNGNVKTKHFEGTYKDTEEGVHRIIRVRGAQGTSPYTEYIFVVNKGSGMVVCEVMNNITHLGSINSNLTGLYAMNDISTNGRKSFIIDLRNSAKIHLNRYIDIQVVEGGIVRAEMIGYGYKELFKFNSVTRDFKRIRI